MVLFRPSTGPPLVVVHRGEHTEGRHLVEEQRKRFPPALEAAVELGIGLREESRIEISAAQIEVTDPRVE